MTFEPNGPSIQCINVTIIDDTVIESPVENFEGEIIDPGIPGVELGTPGVAILRIEDNEGECIVPPLYVRALH